MRIDSRLAVLADEHIDTDRIIPARFLATTTRVGLGQYCFNDWRYLEDGSDNPDFALNQAEAKDCQILVAGRNFGCGSSREHAPWALLEYGIKAVLCSEIADIFRQNALQNGLLAITLDETTHRYLLRCAGLSARIDVAQQIIQLKDKQPIHFQLEPFARRCLLEGVDQLGFLQQHYALIEAFETQHEAGLRRSPKISDHTEDGMNVTDAVDLSIRVQL